MSPGHSSLHTWRICLQNQLEVTSESLIFKKFWGSIRPPQYIDMNDLFWKSSRSDLRDTKFLKACWQRTLQTTPGLLVCEYTNISPHPQSTTERFWAPPPLENFLNNWYWFELILQTLYDCQFTRGYYFTEDFVTGDTKSPWPWQKWIDRGWRNRSSRLGNCRTNIFSASYYYWFLLN